MNLRVGRWLLMLVRRLADQLRDPQSQIYNNMMIQSQWSLEHLANR